LLSSERSSATPARSLLFAVTIFWSAFLLFQVELIAGKFLLPWFGGASSVWATSLVFFQLLLLAGYAYSHFVPLLLGARKHIIVHSGLVLGSAVLLLALGALWDSPITPGISWRPAPDAEPILGVLTLLCITIGLPFLFLSTTGPLLQKWYSFSDPTLSVYRLYAVSNAGSLLGLLSYPLLVEPFLRIRNQGWLWSAMYVVFALAIVAVGARTARLPMIAQTIDEGSGEEAAPVSLGSRSLWLVLPALSSMLLLGSTNVICSEVAVVPLLWVIPLSLYLVSWIVTFEAAGRFYERNKWFPVLSIAVAAGFLLLSVPEMTIKWQVLVFCAVQFVASVVCHGELRSLQPSPRCLTLYYMLIAAGSAIGGLFVLLVAPLVFRAYWEFPLALALILIVLLGRLARDPRSWLRAGPSWLPFVIALAMLLLVGILHRYATFPLRFDQTTVWILAGACTLILIFKLRFAGDQPSPLWTTAAIVAALMIWCGFAIVAQVRGDYDAIAAVRNFYGVIRVRDYDLNDAYERARYLEHGRTTHGLQLLHPQYQAVATSYYGVNTGISLLLTNLPAYAPNRIGVVGLGAGTLALFARPLDHVVFYDINPAVIEVAAGPKAQFTFTREAKGHITTVLGDARLSMERELQSQSRQPYDVIILDAFNGDSPPVHLLTAEAFRLYLALLKPSGVIAVHVSNRNLDLESPVAELCKFLKLDAVRIENDKGPNKEYAATWILVSPDPKRLLQAEIATKAWPIANSRNVRLWTDDYSNLVQILK
jgi:spermidine synthase